MQTKGGILPFCALHRATLPPPECELLEGRTRVTHLVPHLRTWWRGACRAHSGSPHRLTEIINEGFKERIKGGMGAPRCEGADGEGRREWAAWGPRHRQAAAERRGATDALRSPAPAALVTSSRPRSSLRPGSLWRRRLLGCCGDGVGFC